MFIDKITKFNFYLLILLPVALISGPLIPDSIVVLSCFLFFFYFKFHSIEGLKKKLIYILLFFWLVSIISSILSTDILFSIKSSLFYIRIIIFSVVIYIIFNSNEKDLSKFLSIILFIFIILFIDSTFQKFFGYNLVGINLSNTARVSSFFGDELILGSYMVKFYPILVGFVYLIKNSRFYLYYSLISTITLITVFFSAEKTAIAIFLIEFISITFFLNRNLKTKIIIILSLIVLFLFMFFSFPKIKNRIYDQMILNSENFKYLYTRVHTEHYISGLKIFSDYPIIGIGPKMFRKYCNNDEYKISEFSCSTHPHNYSIQLLAETGILGFVVFILFYFFLCFNFIKLIFEKKNNIYKFPLFSLLILNLINFMPLFPGGNFFNNWVSITYSFGFGIYLYIRSKYEEHKL